MLEVNFNKKFFHLKEKDLFINVIKSIYNQSWINEIVNFKKSKKKILIIHNIPLDQNLPASPIETGYINHNEIPISINFIKAFMKVLDLYIFAYTDENRGGDV